MTAEPVNPEPTPDPANTPIDDLLEPLDDTDDVHNRLLELPTDPDEV